MPVSSPPRSSSRAAVSGRPARRRTYHHGDLRRALVEEALRTIQAEGVDALTLREVGRRLGVSRTALYRHFADKGALLAAVAREGFRTFREALRAAYMDDGGAHGGFIAMGRAYVRFAVTHPSHYRVMFGGFVDACDRDPALQDEGAGSFLVLVEAITAEQAAGRLRRDPPQQMARHVWAVVHGLAMLIIDGQLPAADMEASVDYALARLVDGIAA